MAFFGTKMAKLKYEVETLKGLLEDKESDIAILKNERNEWRKKYELVVHTPEYKMDAEAAFRRGQQFAITTMKNNLLVFLESMPKNEEKTDA